MEIGRITERLRSWGIAIVFLVLVAVFSIVTPLFFTINNLRNLFEQNVVYGILACGMLFPIITGGFDLSVGSTAALTGIVTATLLSRGTNAILAVILGLLVGVGIGTLNGVLISIVGINPFVTTLGTMTAVRGLVFIFTRGMPVSGIPPALNVIGMGSIGIIPVPMLIWLLVFACCFFVLRYARFGAYVYAVGGNEHSAFLSGVKVNKIKIISYAISGMLASLAGLVLLFRVMLAVGQAANGYELIAIGACVIGGCELDGGKGGAVEAVLGTLILGVILNELHLLGVSPYWESTITGLMILLAVGLTSRKKK